MGARPALATAVSGRAASAAEAGGGDAVELLYGDVPDAPSAPAAVHALLAAWRQRGTAGLRDFEGRFCCLLHTPGGLLAYREASGLCSMFVRRAPDGRWMAAETVDALRAASPSVARIERGSLHEYLRLLDIAAPASFLEGVQALQAGRALRLLPTGAELVEAAPGSARVAGKFDTALAEVDARLQRSVARCLGSCSPVAAFLSGGIDSALVCAIAARQRPDITALTVGFDGDRHDEAPTAARIAAHLGLRHEVLRFGRQDCLAAFDRMAAGMDQPMADPATMATILAFDHCRGRFDAVLDGTGADEAVGAMPPRHVRLAVEYGSLVPGSLRRLLVRAMRRVPGLAGYTPLLDFEHPAETLMRWKGFTRAEIEELCGEPVSLEHTTFYRTFARFPRGAHFERYSALLDAMPCDRLTQAMKLTGLRVRFPFCARDVDGFLRQLPTEWRHAPGQPKRILRELLARYVPRELWDGPKHGFDFPLHEFLSGDGHMLVQRHVLEGRWLGRGLLKPEVVRRYARQYIAGDRRLMFRVWALVVLGAWLDRHEDLT